MYPKLNTLAGLLAISTLNSKSLFGLGDLCDENSNICERIEGCYERTSRSSCDMKWWAYIPKGKLACPEEGCPLYIWLDGSFDSNTHQKRDQIMQMEMLKRGFVAVNVGYDDSMLRPSFGTCSVSFRWGMYAYDVYVMYTTRV